MSLNDLTPYRHLDTASHGTRRLVMCHGLWYASVSSFVTHDVSSHSWLMMSHSISASHGRFRLIMCRWRVSWFVTRDVLIRDSRSHRMIWLPDDAISTPHLLGDLPRDVSPDSWLMMSSPSKHWQCVFHVSSFVIRDVSSHSWLMTCLLIPSLPQQIDSTFVQTLNLMSKTPQTTIEGC